MTGLFWYMYHLPVVPQRTRVRCPFETALDINVALIHMEQVIQNGITLARIKADDAQGHGSVDEKRLPASDGVDLFEVKMSAHVEIILGLNENLLGP